MIPPQDLKNKTFTRTVRGYNPIEVEDHIKFLLAKYAQLYKESAELEKKLHVVSAKYEEIAGDEDSIRAAVGQAQKLSEAMIESAEKAADDILEKVRTRCETIIEDAELKVESEQTKLQHLRTVAEEFRKTLLRDYSEHLQLMKDSRLPAPDEVEGLFPAPETIRAEAMDGLIPDEIIERAVVAPTKNPELDTFKNFLRPRKRRLSRAEKEILREQLSTVEQKRAALTDEILRTSVDEEEETIEPDEKDILAPENESAVLDDISENQISLADVTEDVNEENEPEEAPPEVAETNTDKN